MTRARTLTIAYTPDSDDAFYYHALEAGPIRLPGYRLHFVRKAIGALNLAALEEEYDVTAISSVMYPHVAKQYAILSVGTSVGRGYGPVLVSKELRTPDELAGRRVGVAGIPTTGWFLLRWLCPEAVVEEMPFDHIAEAVVAGKLDAGVMIHEELLYYPRMQLHCVIDLGAEWCRQHHLPLPVGLNIIRRSLGESVMQDVGATIRRSLRHGLRHPEETITAVSRFGRGAVGQCTRPFVEMFANRDSLQMPADVREALHVLLDELARRGFAPALDSLDIVEGVKLARTVPTSSS